MSDNYIVKNPVKQGFTIALIVFYIFISLFPPLYYFVPIRPSVFMGVFWVGMVVLYPQVLTLKSMFVLFFYTFILAAHHFLGSEYFSDISSVIMPFLTFSCPIFLGEVTYRYIDKNKYRIIVNATSFILVAIILISIPAWLVNPLIMRGASVNATNTDFVQTDLYYWVVDYGIIHQLFILIPIVLFYVRHSSDQKKKFKIWWILFMVALFFIIYAANAGAVFILSIILLFFAILFREKTLSSRVLFNALLIIVLFFIVYYLNILPALISFIQGLMPEHSYSADKLGEIKTLLVAGETEGDLGNRFDFYTASIDLFLKSPFLGTSNSMAIGNHSFLFDQLALLGLFGFIPLYLIYRVYLKRINKTLYQTKLIYILSAAAYLIMLCFKYSFGNIFIFGILPIFCWYGEYLSINNNKNN